MTGRIPALGVRFLALCLLSLVLMVVDHQQQHLDRVRSALSTALYPVRLVVDTPFSLWKWARDNSASRNALQIENSRLRTERFLTQARLQKFRSLEAENARLRAILDAKALVPDQVRIAGIMGVDANPYLVAATVLAGIRHGLDGRIDPGPETTGNGYEGDDTLSVPRDWNEAIAAATKSEFLKDALGEDMHRTFTAVKAAEYARVARTISNVDFDLYLYTV